MHLKCFQTTWKKLHLAVDVLNVDECFDILWLRNVLFVIAQIGITFDLCL